MFLLVPHPMMDVRLRDRYRTARGHRGAEHDRYRGIVSHPAEEIRQLQARVYGRGAAASPADIDRLRALTAPPAAEQADEQPADAVAAESNTTPSTPPDGEIDASLIRGRSWRTSRPVVAGAFALTLVAGIAAGLAIAAPAAAEPMRGVVPPDAEGYVTDSITFYGEIDGVRIWTATAVENDQDCLIAMSDDGSGAGGCAQPGWPQVAVELPRVNGRPFLGVSFDFTDPTARPVVTTSRP